METKPNTKTSEFFSSFIENEAYQSDFQTLPFAQVLNSQQLDHSGLFLSGINAEACGFVSDGTWLQHTAEFRSGYVEGFRTLVPKLTIIRKSSLLMYSRGTREYLCQYDKNRYHRASHILKVRYLVFAMGKDNRPLHSHPMMLSTKGAFCADFGQHLTAFRQSVHSMVGKQMGHRFHALWCFCMALAPELKGTGNDQSWVTSIQNAQMATPENTNRLFLGQDGDTKGLIEWAFNEYSGFGRLNQKTLTEPNEPDEPPTIEHSESTSAEAEYFDIPF